MRRIAAALAVLIVLTAGVLAVVLSRREPAEVTAIITDRVLVRDTVPFGVNLGSWTFWGAEQLMSNVVKNPGFEGLVDGAMVLPAHAGDGSFDDSPAWLARADSFWEGARYSILTGQHAGRSGRIVHSTATDLFGLPSFAAEPNGPMPEPGEAVAVTMDRENALPTQWWFSKDPANSFAPEITDRRPGSPGVRSLRISAGSESPADVASYLDGIGDRAGKLLPLTGSWTLSFWARQARGRTSMRVVLAREGSKAVLAQTVELTGAWRNIRLPFEASDSGPAGLVSLRFQVKGEPVGDVLVDDVSLERNSDAGSPFRQEVVTTLKTLHPSYLRDWQGQLGDTLANRIAPAFARKAWRYRPGDDTQTDFGYGLGEFLDLAHAVGAAPWIVVPPVFDDSECAGLGSWLASSGHLAADKEVLVEFGNENWNELFRPGGIPDPVVQGRAADRCFAAIRQNAGGLKLKTVVNAQFANAERVASYAAESRQADMVAVAPYFALSLPARLSLNERRHLLFENQAPAMKQIVGDAARLHKEAAVYEVNLHTVGGNATEAERMQVLAGLASGTALARTLLEGMAHGMKRQCVYTLAGYDTFLQAGKGHAPLWGIVRDLSRSSRFRPTGLALRMLNDTVRGNMRAVELAGAPDVWAYAFEAGGQLSVVLVSGSSEERRVTVSYGGAEQPGPLTRVSLTALADESSNEDGTEVSVTNAPFHATGRTATLWLKPWSLVILRPERLDR